MGREIRVIGNDAGEQLSILAAQLVANGTYIPVDANNLISGLGTEQQYAFNLAQYALGGSIATALFAYLAGPSVGAWDWLAALVAVLVTTEAYATRHGLAPLARILAIGDPDLAKRLAETPEPGGNGSLLDNTLIIWTNELGKGNSHTLDNIPFVLLGGKRIRPILTLTTARCLGASVDSALDAAIAAYQSDGSVPGLALAVGVTVGVAVGVAVGVVVGVAVGAGRWIVFWRALAAATAAS